MGQVVPVWVMPGAASILLRARLVLVVDQRYFIQNLIVCLTKKGFVCLEVSFNWQTASSANGDLDEAAANETTGILNDINGEPFALC